eukprot:3887050-Amphidinium_carterae.1
MHYEPEEPRHNQGSDYKYTVYQKENLGNDFFQPKVEDVNDVAGQEYFAEEAGKEDDINYYNTEFAREYKKDDVIGFNKLLQHSRQLLRLLLSIGRL